jgi:CHAT domain-containing protein
MTQVNMKEQATERNLKAVHATDILHVATHGFFTIRHINPGKEFRREVTFNSGLILTGANKSLQEETTEFQDDGILTAYEVTNLDLAGTSLVVLSACETGLGNIEIGEGVYGLQRSFLQAGAKNVLISLWKVDDGITNELMSKFYSYLLSTQNIHEALMKAQRDIRNKYPDPAAWGSFILIGK